MHTATMTVSSVGGFVGSVSLSCSVSPIPPQAPTCSLNPGSVQVANDNSLTSTLTISSTARIAAFDPPRDSFSKFSFLALRSLFPAIVLPGWQRNRGVCLRVLFLVCILNVAIGLNVGCGGGNRQQSRSGTPPGNYMITIQATSAGSQHATTLSISVN